MGADKVRVVGNGAEIPCIGGPALAFFTDPDEPFPEQPAIDGAEGEFADQSGLTERMKALRCGRTIGD